MHLATRVEEYLQSVDATKRLVIAGIGDRRDEDIRECATAARMFDHIIIRQEKIFKRKNRRRNNQSNTRGDRLFRSRRDL
jgi:hypothetical protein